MLIDTHAHYDDAKFGGDRDEVIAAVRQGGIEQIINSGANLESSKASLNLAERYDFFYATVGVHPHDAAHTPENTLEILADLAKNRKVVAIGEVGLDFYHNHSDRDSQRRWFSKQMDFAADTNYPVVIHNREAHGECLEMAKRYRGSVKGVFHCYSGSPEMARELLGLGYMLSFGGVVTFANAKTCREVIGLLPLDCIMLETDCPYLAPHPHRGKRNDSGYLPLIAQGIAQIKGVEPEEVIAKTGENARRCFGLP